MYMIVQEKSRTIINQSDLHVHIYIYIYHRYLVLPPMRDKYKNKIKERMPTFEGRLVEAHAKEIRHSGDRLGDIV